jgi:hypothetical protein
MNTARANSRSIVAHHGDSVFVAKNSVALLVKVE